ILTLLSKGVLKLKPFLKSQAPISLVPSASFRSCSFTYYRLLQIMIKDFNIEGKFERRKLMFQFHT
ncbi:MAG: hypothetical protein COZ31_08410, partial [Nitrospirae bacterium CG_4_10_14_3_um_filter_44_29]